jgi:hypothetical protein
MNILVGWWNRDTGQLVDISGFDAVPTADYGIWIPAVVNVTDEEVPDILRTQARGAK